MSTSTRTDRLATLLDLSRAAAIVARRVEGPISGHGLSLTDVMILLALRSADGGRLRRVDLAGRLGMSQSSVTRLILPLEKLGIVTRHSDPRDRRAAWAELTPAGRRMADEVEVTARDAADDAMRGWPEAEVAALAGGLTRLCAGAPSLLPR
ncbi:MAG: MarR family transcriptional regulator [Miltoncostaeaceae bacterium]